MFARNAWYIAGWSSASAQMDAMFRIAFDEDKAILEAIEAQERLPQNVSQFGWP